MFERIISVENLLLAWEEFVRGKRCKPDVLRFERQLFDNILQVHNDLARGTYRHGSYHAFQIADPKPRHIHKALVRDRLLHHAIHRVLYPIFDRAFISDSFSCRVEKGVHAAGQRFRTFLGQVSSNGTRTGWALKCDIKKFFASINHCRLKDILSRHISDMRVLNLLSRIIGSFEAQPGCGLPLGNLTSQLFANIYLNELDQFVKHQLRTRWYIRYADDFVVLSHDRNELMRVLSAVQSFLRTRLGLSLHPSKVSLQTIASGVDFLGWVYFPTHKTLRTTTRHRMMRRLQESPTLEAYNSYLGLLGHGNAYGLQVALQNLQWLHGSKETGTEG